MLFTVEQILSPVVSSTLPGTVSLHMVSFSMELSPPPLHTASMIFFLGELTLSISGLKAQHSHELKLLHHLSPFPNYESEIVLVRGTSPSEIVSNREQGCVHFCFLFEFSG